MFKKLLSLAAILFSSNIFAANIQVEDAWAYASNDGRTNANIYFHITSSEKAKIVSASSSASDKVIFETMDHSNGTMKILTVDHIELPAAKTLDLTSEHRHHLKLIDLKKPLKVGDKVEVIMTVNSASQAAQNIPVTVQIRD